MWCARPRGPNGFGKPAESREKFVRQFLGGRGYIETNVAPQLLRDARVTRILEGPTEALVMFLGSRVLNDGAEFQSFITQTLGAPEIAERVATVATEIDDRCANGPFTNLPSAKRWAHSLIGSVATDAVLLAVLNGKHTQQPDHARDWARQQFERSIADALAASGEGAIDLGNLDLTVLSDGYSHAIGDVEQQLAGEDHGFDELLRGAGLDNPVPVETPRQASALAADPVPASALDSSTPIAAPRADIEQFIIDWMAHELKIPAHSIDPARSFFDYGIDSVTTVMLTASLEEWLGCELYPELVYDFPIIRKFVRHVAQQNAPR